MWFLIAEKYKRTMYLLLKKVLLSMVINILKKQFQLGATSIICQVIPSEKKEGITYIQVEDSDAALAVIAANIL